MPANRNFAFKQLCRFQSFPGAPQTDTELLERAEFLASISGNDERCKEMADRMMRTVRYFPLPVDMETAMENCNSLPEWKGPADPRNPFDQILDERWFYEGLEPELKDKTFQMLKSPRKDVAKFAEQVIAGLKAGGKIPDDAAQRDVPRNARRVNRLSRKCSTARRANQSA
jgi:hypothetical protein